MPALDPATALLIVRLIDLVAVGLELAAEDREAYAFLSGRLKDMIREGRGPTEEERAELEALSRDATRRIRDALRAKRGTLEELSGPEPTEQP